MRVEFVLSYTKFLFVFVHVTHTHTLTHRSIDCDTWEYAFIFFWPASLGINLRTLRCVGPICVRVGLIVHAGDLFRIGHFSRVLNPTARTIICNVCFALHMRSFPLNLSLERIFLLANFPIL